DEGAGAAVPGEGHAALRAARRRAAGGTLEIGGEATPVEEHERLSLRGEVALERRTDLARQELLAAPGTAGRAQVDQIDRGQGMRSGSRGEDEPGVALVERGLVRLRGRRRRGEHRHAAGKTRPYH